MYKVLCKTFGVYQAEKRCGSVYNFVPEKSCFKRAGQFSIFKKIGYVVHENTEKLGYGQEEKHVQIKGYLWKWEPASAETVVIKQIIQMATVFYGIYDRSFPVNLFQCFRNVFFKLYAFKKPVKKPG